jgi:hypothetical protein
MILIEVTSINGVAPYNISICDLSKTNCYVVATGTPTLPLYLGLPPQLSSANQVLLVVTDSQNCEYFEVISCVPPSPTPTNTPTPTPSPTPSNCLCLTFTNNTLSNLTIGYTRCDGLVTSETIYSNTILYYCGSNPNADPGVVINVGNPCVNNTCPTPTPTPTPLIYKQFQSGEEFDFQDEIPYDFQDS